MNRIYLDNAATTRLDPEVLDAMLPLMTESFGNPSSIHAHGREVRAAVEKARKTIAGLLNTSPSEIFFTSGGTEADNTAIYGSVESLRVKHVISSPIEHHAVLHTLEFLEKQGKIKLSLLDIDSAGVIDYNQLEDLLRRNPNSLVSLMHGNNEIGNLLEIERVGEMCQNYQAVFHSDTVQTMGHYRHDLQKLAIDFIVGAGHKFHGPKGVGFLYINARNRINPFIHGGAQERNMRGGTENIYGIVGIAKALEIAYREMDEHRKQIEKLKSRLIDRMKNIEGVTFNGLSANLDKSLYTVLNVSFPPNEDNDMLLFNLDIARISCSGGSACASGTNIGSHVLDALNIDPARGNVRFSFGKYNTEEEIDYVANVVSELFSKKSILA
ncbi:MAG: cysteine desulfurase family protein [Spirosomataceae bacterium]